MNPFLPEDVQRDLVLASRSPRRRDILSRMKLEFDVVPAADHVENGASHRDPFECAVLRARLKAADVAARRPSSVVIGADTVVVIDGEVLDKPVDDEQSVRFLHKLSGREHTVATGIAVRRDAAGLELAACERTQVRFRPLSDADVRAYIATGEGRDKAGGYAVQGLGADLVRSINGCYYNVVGLPVSLLFDLLRKV